MMTYMISNSELTDMIQYDFYTGQLTIHFLDTDTTWRYYGISEDILFYLVNADSIGDFFNHEIRNNYTCERIENMPA